MGRIVSKLTFRVAPCQLVAMLQTKTKACKVTASDMEKAWTARRFWIHSVQHGCPLWPRAQEHRQQVACGGGHWSGEKWRPMPERTPLPSIVAIDETLKDSGRLCKNLGMHAV